MTGTGTQIGTSAFNNGAYNNSEYVGYMYTLGQQYGTNTPSTIKTTIDNWYAETTLEKDAATKKLVSQDQIFCNDRSPSSSQTAAWTSTGYFDYGALGRLGSNKTPILTCPTASDKFTSKGSSIGNKKLEYPVGLITADEVSMAGGVYHSDNSSYSNNSSYYLYTNQIYWLGSPGTSPSNGFVYGFIVYSSGYINYYGVGSSNGVRPVISLSSEAKLSGYGTYSNPYTVS